MTDLLKRLRELHEAPPETWEAQTDAHAPSNGKGVAWVVDAATNEPIADMCERTDAARGRAALIADMHNSLPFLLAVCDAAMALRDARREVFADLTDRIGIVSEEHGRELNRKLASAFSAFEAAVDALRKWARLDEYLQTTKERRP